MFSDELDMSLFPLDRITAVRPMPRYFTADFVSLVGEGFEPDVIQRGFPGSQEIGLAFGIDARGLSDGHFDNGRRFRWFFESHGLLLSLKLI
jgi:hypothetical protein